MTEEKINPIPAVSIIVPVCNVERYLQECLDGLHAQTLKEIEVILIDDGSTDGCPQILKENAAADPRMRVITKPNGGYGSGINRGLSEAKGQYIGIVEPDDKVDPHMYEELYTAAVSAGYADIVKSSYWEYYDLPGQPSFLRAPNVMNCMPKDSFTANVYKKYELLRHHPSIWSGIYRLEFLKEHQIRMMEVPGGGWVDNPFFFETFLQAKTYVWLPAAYYYYRQTNPDSSSNLKNFRMPYDRLRDLRALFRRLNVTDPQILAYLYARHFFYTYSVIGEWGFSEKDPELKALIHEAMAELDPNILRVGIPGISPEYIAFYESVVKDPAYKIKERKEAPTQPEISVVVPIYDDRHVMIRTLDDLASQRLKEFEVICVDGDSIDVSREIAESFAKKDARFQILDAPEGYAAAMSVGFAAAKAPVIALVFPGQNIPKDYLTNVANAMKQDADLCITLPHVSHPWCPWDHNSLVPVAGSRMNLLLCICDQPSRFAVKKEFLDQNGIQVRPEDENGRLLMSDVIAKAKQAAVCFGNVPYKMAQQRSSAREADLTALDHYMADRKILDAAAVSARQAQGEVLGAFRAMAVHVLLSDLQEYAYAAEGEEIFRDIQDVYFGAYGLADAGRMIYSNMDEFLTLERRLSSSYTAVLRETASEAYGAMKLAGRKRDLFKDMKLIRAAANVYRLWRQVRRKAAGKMRKDKQ